MTLQSTMNASASSSGSGIIGHFDPFDGPDDDNGSKAFDPSRDFEADSPDGGAGLRLRPRPSRNLEENIFEKRGEERERILGERRIGVVGEGEGGVGVGLDRER